MRSREDADRGSRGAIALMTAASMIAIFGFTALSVDLGNAWQTRRHLVNATDAAALAAAQEYAVLGNGCTTVAPTYIVNNKADATMVACTPSSGAASGATSGYVLVKAESTVIYAFAPVIGVDSNTLASTTVVRYGIPKALIGLRPFGLCVTTLLKIDEYKEWRAAQAGADPPEASEPALIQYDKSENPTDCNGDVPVPGNWATLDFDGGENSNSDTQAWTLKGYSDLVYPGPIPGDTGAFSPSLSTELLHLEAKEIVFPIPLFDEASGNGSNATFNIVGFVSVMITDFNTSGAQAQRSLTLRFVAAVAEGACCDASGIDTGTRVLQICAVDDEDLSACPVT